MISALITRALFADLFGFDFGVGGWRHVWWLVFSGTRCGLVNV